jgi:hypothetical protein
LRTDAAAAFDSALRQTARPTTFDFSSNLRSFNLRNLNLRIFDLIVFIARISNTTLKVPKSLNLSRLPLRYFLVEFSDALCVLSNDRATMPLRSPSNETLTISRFEMMKREFEIFRSEEIDDVRAKLCELARYGVRLLSEKDYRSPMSY